MGRVRFDVVTIGNSVLSLSVVEVRLACAMNLTRKQAEPPPQIRFILLLPTVHERIAEGLFKQAEADFEKAKKKAEAKDKAGSDLKKVAEPDLQYAETKDVFKKNELYDENVIDPADTEYLEDRRQDRLNISRDALLKIMTKYDIAPGACSHIRGQEQIFGSRTTKNEMNEVTAVGKLHLQSARPYLVVIC